MKRIFNIQVLRQTAILVALFVFAKQPWRSEQPREFNAWAFWTIMLVYSLALYFAILVLRLYREKRRRPR
jgi:hypothetical protein